MTRKKALDMRALNSHLLRADEHFARRSSPRVQGRCNMAVAKKAKKAPKKAAKKAAKKAKKK
ncbi:MAG: hypothetical protein IPH13_17720 [Planctomycetes bacterium]|nr:hypothetical protein [Planctomycetota bacterium]MCC7169964.1 hypothetical protein [Planctomycetota bacterium]